MLEKLKCLYDFVDTGHPALIRMCDKLHRATKRWDLHADFKRLEVVYQAKEGTPEFDEMEILVTL